MNVHCRELCRAASKPGTPCSLWPASMRPAASGIPCAPAHLLSASLVAQTWKALVVKLVSIPQALRISSLKEFQETIYLIN